MYEMYDEDFLDEKVAASENENETFATVSASEEVTTPKLRSGTLIYCGPDKPKLGLKKFSVFINGLPAAYEDAILKIPEVEKLIVPYEKLEVTRYKIAKSGTPEHEYYARIENTK